MANKNIAEQLEKNKSEVEKKQEEIRQLKNKERKILSTQRNAEQKIRTRRLIMKRLDEMQIDNDRSKSKVRQEEI